MCFIGWLARVANEGGEIAVPVVNLIGSGRTAESGRLAVRHNKNPDAPRQCRLESKIGQLRFWHQRDSSGMTLRRRESPKAYGELHWFVARSSVPAVLCSLS